MMSQEIFGPLSCGGKLVLAVPGGEKDTQYLAHVIAAQGITFCQFVPSQLDATLQVLSPPYAVAASNHTGHWNVDLHSCRSDSCFPEPARETSRRAAVMAL